MLSLQRSKARTWNFRKWCHFSLPKKYIERLSTQKRWHYRISTYLSLYSSLPTPSPVTRVPLPITFWGKNGGRGHRKITTSVTYSVCKVLAKFRHKQSPCRLIILYIPFYFWCLDSCLFMLNCHSVCTKKRKDGRFNWFINNLHQVTFLRLKPQWVWIHTKGRDGEY